MHYSTTTGRRLSLIVLTAAALTVAGCGESPGSDATGSGPTASTAGSETDAGAAGPQTTPTSGTPATQRTPTPGPRIAQPPAQPKPRGPASAGVLDFNRVDHNFGTITDTQHYTTTFGFTNAGPETVVILEVKSACGCTVPTLSKYQYAPGEHGVISVEFDPKGKQGKTDKVLKVITNAQSNRITELRLTSLIHPILRFEKVQRFGRIGLGQLQRRIVPIRYSDPNLVFGDITVNDPYITPAIVQQGIVESDGDEVLYRADIELTVSADHPWGTFFAKQLSIPVTGTWRENVPAKQQTFGLFLLGEVFGELTPSQGIVSLSQIKRGQQFTRTFDLKRKGRVPFTITSAFASVSIEGVTVRTEDQGPGRVRVIVEGAVPANFRGSIRGRIELATNVPGEEVVTLPVSGFVQ